MDKSKNDKGSRRETSIRRNRLLTLLRFHPEPIPALASYCFRKSARNEPGIVPPGFETVLAYRVFPLPCQKKMNARGLVAVESPRTAESFPPTPQFWATERP